jgi:hypothetical protein
MANQEYLNILRQGVEVWNQWKATHPYEEVDLQRADFHKSNLRGVNLSSTDLKNADFSGADLTWSNLNRADLSNANLSEVNLTLSALMEANLTGARLPKAELTLANLRSIILVNGDLRGAKLDRANLINANLGGADFTEVQIGNTAFDNVDLVGVKGLDTIYHFGPSSIGIDTIYRSKGNIPEIFLRGAGIPDSFISYTQSLIGQSIEYYTCFISYSSQDQDFAKQLYADLQSKGVRCWFAPEALKIGDKIRPRIDESIRLYDKLLLMLSQSSVTSQWVEQEVERAFARERKENKVILFPIRLDNTVMEIEEGWPALIRNTRNIGDFSCWKDHDAYQKAFDRLLRDLKAEGS